MCYEFSQQSEGLEVNSGKEYPPVMHLFCKYKQGAADIVN